MLQGNIAYLGSTAIDTLSSLATSHTCHFRKAAPHCIGVKTDKQAGTPRFEVN